MRAKSTFVLALTVVMVMTPFGAASAQSGSVADDIKSRISAAERYDEYAVETASDSEACRQTRGFFADLLDSDAKKNKKFVKDFARQINKHGDDVMVIHVELIDDVGLLDVHALVGDDVTIRGLGINIGTTQYSIGNTPGTAEEQLDALRAKTERSIKFLEDIIAEEEANIAARKEQGKDTEKAEAQLEFLYADLADMQRTLDEMTLEGALVRGLALEGEPAAILAAIADDTIYTAAVRTDPHKTPSIIRRIARERDLSKSEAVRWLRDHRRVGNRMIIRASSRPDHGVEAVLSSCS